MPAFWKQSGIAAKVEFTREYRCALLQTLINEAGLQETLHETVDELPKHPVRQPPSQKQDQLASAHPLLRIAHQEGVTGVREIRVLRLPLCLQGPEIRESQLPDQ